MKSFADFISEATPRGKAIQRGKISKAEAQKRQAKEDRKREAQERRDERAKAGIDALIGSDADRKAAAAARANPKGERIKALKRTIADRMAKGAKEHGLDEERRETEIGITGQPIPNKKLGPKKRHEFEKKRRENLKKRPGDAPGDSKLIKLMRARAEKEGNVAEGFKDLTPEKEKRVEKRAGELIRDVKLKSAKIKELRKKPLAKFRPGVKSEIKANVKSAKKNAELFGNASDALIRTSVGRSAKIQKQIEDLKRRENS